MNGSSNPFTDDEDGIIEYKGKFYHPEDWYKRRLKNIADLQQQVNILQRNLYHQDGILEDVVAERDFLRQEVEKWRKEALQQYPTPDAYEAACKALEKHRKRADTAEQQVNTLTEALIKIREHESNKSIFHPGINVHDTADKALQSLESPREEQTP